MSKKLSYLRKCVRSSLYSFQKQIYGINCPQVLFAKHRLLWRFCKYYWIVKWSIVTRGKVVFWFCLCYNNILIIIKITSTESFDWLPSFSFFSTFYNIFNIFWNISSNHTFYSVIWNSVKITFQCAIWTFSWMSDNRIHYLASFSAENFSMNQAVLF